MSLCLLTCNITFRVEWLYDLLTDLDIFWAFKNSKAIVPHLPLPIAPASIADASLSMMRDGCWLQLPCSWSLNLDDWSKSSLFRSKSLIFRSKSLLFRSKSSLFRSESLLFRGRKLLLANATRPLVPACPGQWAAAQLLQGGAEEQQLLQGGAEEQAFLQLCRLAVSKAEGEGSSMDVFQPCSMFACCIFNWPFPFSVPKKKTI